MSPIQHVYIVILQIGLVLALYAGPLFSITSPPPQPPPPQPPPRATNSGTTHSCMAGVITFIVHSIDAYPMCRMH